MLNKGLQVPIILQLSYGIGILVFFGKTGAAQHTEIKCILQTTEATKQSDRADKISCSRQSSTTPHPIQTLPLNVDHPEDIKEIEVSNLGTRITDAWLLADHKTFHNFTNLAKLAIRSNPIISTAYDDPFMKTILLNELFNLPNLTSIEIRYWSRDDSYAWKFPKGILWLRITECGYTTFDLTSYQDLKFVDFSNNNLKYMPILSVPPPPLEALWLKGMASLNFSAMDITELCLLKDIQVFDRKAFIRNTEGYCECVRLRQYIVEFDFSQSNKFECDPDTRKKRFSKNCQDYPIEAAIEIHREACSEFLPITTTPAPVPPPPITPHRKPDINVTIHPPAPCPPLSCQGFVIADVLLAMMILLVDVPLCVIFRRKIFLPTTTKS